MQPYIFHNDTNAAAVLTDNSNSASFTWLASPLVLTSSPTNWNANIYWVSKDLT